MAKAGIRWSTPPEVLGRAVIEYKGKLDRAVLECSNVTAKEILSYAKAHAPWNDQTGLARSTLSSGTEAGGGSVTIFLQHGAPYGIWLEVKFAGRDAIVMPAIEVFGPKVMARLQAMLR